MMLPSAQQMMQRPEFGKTVPVSLTREDAKGLVFLSCSEIPEMFVAVKSEGEIREAIDTCLRNAFRADSHDVHVYTNGSISGPTIEAMVWLTDRV